MFQPSAWRRRWEVREDGRVLADVRLPALSSRYVVRAGDEHWTVQRDGLGGQWADAVVDEGGNKLAVVRRGGWPPAARVGREEAQWRRSGPLAWAIERVDGTTLAEAELRSSLRRANGTIRVAADLDLRDALAGGVIALYEVLRLRDIAGEQG